MKEWVAIFLLNFKIDTKGILCYVLIKLVASSSSLTLKAYYDVGWVDDCRSTYGEVIYLGHNLVSWWSKESTNDY